MEVEVKCLSRRGPRASATLSDWIEEVRRLRYGHMSKSKRTEAEQAAVDGRKGCFRKTEYSAISTKQRNRMSVALTGFAVKHVDVLRHQAQASRGHVCPVDTGVQLRPIHALRGPLACPDSARVVREGGVEIQRPGEAHKYVLSAEEG